MPTYRGARYASVRSLARGLAILKALNAEESGRATPQLLSDVTGLHRTTVRRLLETLVDEGYVRRSGSDDSFRLALAVRGLSEGYTDDEHVSTVAPPIMGELLRRVQWPSDLATPDGGEMTIRETTHRFSPLSFHRSMVGRSLPMLLTASGRAYLGHCSESERDGVLQILRAGGGGPEQAALASDARLIANLVGRVQKDGYGVNLSDWADQSRISAIAVPVYFDQRVLATLNVVYLTSAIKPHEAIERFVPPLLEASERIGQALGREADRDEAPGD